ncbi:MAG: hypothetical protein K2N35_08430, partial [Muribaculaceae bacterium]|nr:hypothetical protein [Muribaculaceae bacterium]
NVYIRLRFSQNVVIPADFNSSVYELIDHSGKDIRYNPRMIFVAPEDNLFKESESKKPQFDMEEIKQMTDPREFVRKTADSYSGLTEEDLDELFREVEEEVKKMEN